MIFFHFSLHLRVLPQSRSSPKLSKSSGLPWFVTGCLLAWWRGGSSIAMIHHQSLLCCFFFSWDRVSLNTPDWTQTLDTSVLPAGYLGSSVCHRHTQPASTLIRVAFVSCVLGVGPGQWTYSYKSKHVGYFWPIEAFSCSLPQELWVGTAVLTAGSFPSWGY